MPEMRGECESDETMKTLKKIFEAILVSCGYYEKEIPKEPYETVEENYIQVRQHLSDNMRMPKCKPPRKKAALDEIRDELAGIRKQLERMNENKVEISGDVDCISPTEYLLKNKNNANHLEKSIGEL